MEEIDIFFSSSKISETLRNFSTKKWSRNLWLLLFLLRLTTRLYLLQDLRCAWSIDIADTFQNSHRLSYYTINGRLQIHGYSGSIGVSCRNKHFCTQIKKAHKYASR